MVSFSLKTYVTINTGVIKTVLRRKIKFGLFATFAFSNYIVISENNYEKWAILNKCIGYTHVFLFPLLTWVNL